MINDYDALAQAVVEAGFFTNGVEERGNWHRTYVSSKKRSGGGFTGNSFWVSRRPNGWYLGTWAPRIYFLPDEHRLAELCISWLSRVPTGTCFDFDDRLKSEFQLVALEEEAFNKDLGPA